MSTFEFEETYRTTKRRRNEFRAKDDDADVSDAITDYIKTTEKLERMDEEEQNDSNSNSSTRKDTSNHSESTMDRKEKGSKRKLMEREDGGEEKTEKATDDGKRVIELDDVPKTVKASDIKASKQLESSYGKVRRGKGLKLKFKGKSSSVTKLLSLKKTIDKKEKNKKMKSKKSKDSKRKKKRLKYKTATELLDERVKKKTDKFAWF